MTTRLSMQMARPADFAVLPVPVLAIAAIAVALMIPAFWNGYPLLYFDSVDYVSIPYTWAMPIYRTAGYGVFAGIGRIAGSLWAVVAAQSIILAYVLFEARRVFVPELPAWRAIAGLVLLGAATGLPWVASTVMPDVFTAITVILVAILAFADDALGRARRAAFILLLALSIAAHPTHVALAGGLLVCVFAIDVLAARGWPVARLQGRSVLTALVLGMLVAAIANWAVSDRFSLAPRTTSLLTVAVLFQKGLGERYLGEVCGEDQPRRSVMCPYRGQHPKRANDFIWHNKNFSKMGGWDGLLKDTPRVLEGIMLRYPASFARAVVELMTEQTVTVRTGEGFRTMVGYADSEIRRYYPDEAGQFLAARQQAVPQGARSAIDTLNQVQVPVMLAGLSLLLLAAVLAAMRRDRAELTLVTLVFLAYLGNAFICGAISNPADRYGNRIAWLPLLVSLVVLPRLGVAVFAREKTFSTG